MIRTLWNRSKTAMRRGCLSTRDSRHGKGAVAPHRAAIGHFLEPMEARLMLAVDPIISEFMASNKRTLQDRFGDYSDWIEICNPDTSAVNLKGWWLTINSQKLTGWQFPDVTVEPGQYLKVFASKRDLRVSGQELHTDFNLSADGGYLALVKPDGTAIASQYVDYPKQIADISYGVTWQSNSWPLLSSGTNASVLVPTADIGSDWIGVSYPDSSWQHGPLGVGFDTTTGAALPTGSLFYGKFGAGGTYNLYEVVWSPDTWTNAYNAARNTTREGKTGHLVAISSAEENAFVQSIVPSDCWIGLTDEESFPGAHHYGDTSRWPLPDPGKVPTSTQRGAGFVWVNGDPFTYQSWQIGQPNGYNNEQHYVRMAKSNGTYNDQTSYQTYPYVIEYDLNSPTIPPPPSGDQPLPYRFSVFEAYSPTPLTNIGAAATFLGTATTNTFSYNLPAINLVLSGSSDGRFPAGMAFKGVAPTGQNTNFAARISATIRIPSTGQWTFGVNSDDGFQLKIDGATFTAAYGTSGTIASGDTMTFPTTRTAGDSFGVANLDAGEHHVELTYYQGASAASVEFFAAQGAKSSFDGSFKLVGDTGAGGLALVGMKDLIKTDIQSAMLNKNASAYLRIPFNVTDLDEMTRLTLRMKYDDAFIAYINGHEVARSDNTPASAAWNSQATYEFPDSEAVVFENFDISSAMQFLNASGTNVLAIQALNASVDSPDFLILPELVASTPVVLAGQPRYFTAPTPGKANGTGTADLGPILSTVAHTPAAPTDADAVVVTIDVHKALSIVIGVTLHYRIFSVSGETEVDLSMFDDGAHGDGKALDGVYGATIPASAAGPGQLVRYYITAADAADRQSRWPLIPAQDPDPDSTRKWPEYEGFMVADPSVTSTMPIIYWFVTDVSAANYSRSGTRGSIYYNGQFLDNVFMRSRGGSATGGTKVQFNRGYYFQFDPTLDPVSEIDLNFRGGLAPDEAWIRPVIAFETFRDAGSPASICFPMRLQVNGQYGSVRIFVEEPDDEYLKRQGFYGDGALYKTPNSDNGQIPDASYFEKKYPNDTDYSDLQAFLDGFHQMDPVAKQRYLLDNFDIPRFLDFQAATVLCESLDAPQKNYFLYQDTYDPLDNPNGTNEWMFLPWDQHLSFGKSYGISDYNARDPQAHPFFGDSNHPKIDGSHAWNYLIDAALDTPVIKEMYLRRLRTIMDELLQPTATAYADRYYENRLDQLYALLMGDALFKQEVGDLKWAFDAIKNQYLPKKRTHFYIDHSENTAYPGCARIPAPQQAHPMINFGAVEYNPASGNQDQEYIELRNPNAYAVDISGWHLDDGVDYAFEPGMVIPANSSIYVSPSPLAFRTRTTGPTGGQGLLVFGPYKNHLSAWGETVRLLDAAHTPVTSIRTPGTPSAAQRSLRITEIMYNPPPAAGTDAPDNEEFEFIELQNISAQPLSLNGVRFVEGIEYTFGNVQLAPAQFTVVVKNRQAFESRYGVGAVNIAGEYGLSAQASLNNKGERIQLIDAVGEEILDFSFDGNWQPSADGLGRSIVIRNAASPIETWSDSFSWRASAMNNGSPGAADPDPALGSPTVSIVHVRPETQPAAVDSISIVFSEPVNGFPMVDLVLLRDTGAANLLTAAQTLSTIDHITWVLGGLGSITSAAGEYTLYVVAVADHVTDYSGNPLVAGDQDKFYIDPLVPALSITPVSPDPRKVSVDSITFTFTQPVMGFDLSDPRLERDGVELLLTYSQTLTTTDKMTWVLGGLSLLTGTRGTYVLTLDPDGSGITDLTGTRHLSGRVVESFVMDNIPPTVSITPVSPDPRDTPVDSITIVFSEPVIGFGLSSPLFRRDGMVIPLTSGQTLTSIDSKTWVLGNLGGLTSFSGNYVLTLAGAGSGITDLQGNALVGAATEAFKVDTLPLTVSIAAVLPDPRNTAVASVTLTFNKLVTGFDPGDLRLTRDAGLNLLTPSQTLASSDGKIWLLGNLSAVTGETGDYELRLISADSGIADAVGHTLQRDVVETFMVDRTAPTASITEVTPDPRSTPVEFITMAFSEPVKGFDLADLALTREGQVVPLTAEQTLASSDQKTWTLGNLAGLTDEAGQYILKLTAQGSKISDLLDNPLVADAAESFTVVSSPLTAAITAVSPDPSHEPVDSMTITFSDAVTGFDVGDLSLIRDGGGNLLTPSQTLASADQRTWTLGNLSSLTGRLGSYILTLHAAGSGIMGPAGQPLSAGATESFVIDTIGSQANTVRLQRDPADAGVLNVTIDAQPAYPVWFASLPRVHVVADTGPQNLILDFGNGNMLPAAGLRFDGADSGVDSLTLISNPGSGASPIEFDNDGTVALILDKSAMSFDTPQRLASLTLTNNARAVFNAGAKVLWTRSLSIDTGGAIDLNDNDLVVQADPATRQAVLDQVSHWIKSGRAGSADRWTGPGIFSTAARSNDMTGLAVMLNQKSDQLDPVYSKFADQEVDASSILVKYTWNGDANLDGVVNADDYFLVDGGFITQAGGYHHGDLNYDGVVNADDYFLIDSAFLGQTGPLATASPAAPDGEVLMVKASAELNVPKQQRKREWWEFLAAEPAM